MSRRILQCLSTLAILTLAAESMASSPQGDGDYRELRGDDLILRVRPDKDAKAVSGRLRNGDVVAVLGCEKHNGNSWCRVEYGNTLGWIGEQRLRQVDGYQGRPPSIWEVTGAGGGLPLRANPDKDARPVVEGLRNGDQVKMLGCERHQGHEWCRVEFRNYVGWIGKARLRQQ